MYAKCLVLYPGDTLECYPFNVTMCAADSFSVMRAQITMFVQTSAANPVVSDTVTHLLDDPATQTFASPPHLVVWWCDELAAAKNKKQREDPEGTSNVTMNGSFNELATRLIGGGVNGSRKRVHGPAIVSAYRADQGGGGKGNFINVSPSWLMASKRAAASPVVSSLLSESSRLLPLDSIAFYTIKGAAVATESRLPTLSRPPALPEPTLPTLSHSNMDEAGSSSNNQASFVHTHTSATVVEPTTTDSVLFDSKSMGSFLSVDNYPRQQQQEEGGGGVADSVYPPPLTPVVVVSESAPLPAAVGGGVVVVVEPDAVAEGNPAKEEVDDAFAAVAIAASVEEEEKTDESKKRERVEPQEKKEEEKAEKVWPIVINPPGHAEEVEKETRRKSRRVTAAAAKRKTAPPDGGRFVEQALAAAAAATTGERRTRYSLRLRK